MRSEMQCKGLEATDWFLVSTKQANSVSSSLSDLIEIMDVVCQNESHKSSDSSFRLLTELQNLYTFFNTQ